MVDKYLSDLSIKNKALIAPFFPCFAIGSNFDLREDIKANSDMDNKPLNKINIIIMIISINRKIISYKAIKQNDFLLKI